MTRGFIFILFIVPTLLFCSNASAGELKWHWSRGDKLYYVVSAELDVRKPVPLEGHLEGAIHVNVVRQDMAIFKFHLYKNVARDNTGSYESPIEVLRNASVLGKLDEYSRVTDIEKPELRDNIAQYIAAWFPPLKKDAKTGQTWRLNIPGGVGLTGDVRYDAMQYGEEDNRIAIIKFSYTSGSDTNLTRKISGTAYFDLELGRYYRIQRTIHVRGTREMTVNMPSKTGTSSAVKRNVDVDELRTAECILVSSPENVDPRVREREKIETLMQRAESDPKDLPARLWLGQLYAARKEMEKAKAYFIQALGIREDLEARVFLARIYLNEGDLEKAEEHFRIASDKFPEAVSAKLGLGHVVFKRGRFAQALEAADSVLKETAGSAGAHYLRGLALGKLEAQKEKPDFEAATEEIRKYVELDRNLSEKERRIKFSEDGTLRVTVEAAGNYRFTEEELVYGRQLIRRVLTEAAERLNISDGELLSVLDFLAGLIEKSTEEMIDEFIKDREKTGAKIEKVFSDSSKPDAGKIAAAVKGNWDLFPYLAAVTFQPPDQAREMLLAYIDETLKDYEGSPKSRCEIYIMLAETYLDDPKTNRKKIDEWLKYARHTSGDNTLPWLISAHFALLDMHILGKGSLMDFIENAAALTRFDDFRTEVLNERLKLLEETKFPSQVPKSVHEKWTNAIRLTTAASWKPDSTEKALRTFLRNLLALSRSFRDGRNSLVEKENMDKERRAKFSILLAKQCTYVSYLLRAGTDMVELSLDAASKEEEFRKTMIKGYEDLEEVGDIKKNKENYETAIRQYSELHEKQRPYFHAVERYSEERDRALGIMPITDPVQAAARAAEILNGEKQAFEKAVKEWLEARSSREDDSPAEPLGPAIDSPFGPTAPEMNTKRRTTGNSR
ncbi:MAG: tetratricopeptide repeat protein [Planctomycetota bacterium]|jgi:tetratricopeptide (TPR) repeat protein